MAERRYKPTKRVKESKKKNYKFSDKTHPKLGILSVFIGSIALVIMIVISYISSSSHGKGGLYLGLFGLISFGLSVFGLVTAMKSVNEKEIYYTLPVIGIAVNGFLVIACSILYMIGLV